MLDSERLEFFQQNIVKCLVGDAFFLLNVMA